MLCMTNEMQSPNFSVPLFTLLLSGLFLSLPPVSCQIEATPSRKLHVSPAAPNLSVMQHQKIGFCINFS